MGEDGPSLPPPLLHCMSGVFGGGGGGERIAAPAEKIPRPHKKSHINNRCSISRIIIFKLMDRRSDARIFLAKNVQALLFRISLKHYKLSPPPQREAGNIAGVLPAGRGPGEGAPRYPPGSAGLGADHHQALKLAEFCIFLLKIFFWGGREGRSGRRARTPPSPSPPLSSPAPQLELWPLHAGGRRRQGGETLSTEAIQQYFHAQKLLPKILYLNYTIRLCFLT